MSMPIKNEIPKELTKAELKDIYYNHDVIEASNILGMSVPTMMNFIREAKIPLKGRKKILKIK